jgi:hypothetical protein
MDDVPGFNRIYSKSNTSAFAPYRARFWFKGETDNPDTTVTGALHKQCGNKDMYVGLHATCQ